MSSGGSPEGPKPVKPQAGVKPSVVKDNADVTKPLSEYKKPSDYAKENVNAKPDLSKSFMPDPNNIKERNIRGPFELEKKPWTAPTARWIVGVGLLCLAGAAIVAYSEHSTASRAVARQDTVGSVILRKVLRIGSDCTPIKCEERRQKKD